jgi:hypothetical protein
MTIIYLSLTFWISFRRSKKIKEEELGISRQIIHWIFYILWAGILYIFLLNVFFWIFVLATNDWREESFDSEKWKKEPNTRVLMIEDLKNKKILDNKSKTEVINLLGNPNNKDSTYENFINDLYKSDSLNPKNDIIYRLGARNGVLQPIRHLEIWFRNDTVSKYEIN